MRGFLQSHLFGSPETTADVLSTIAGGMITVTSITFSLLLVALQQSAASMSHAVFDQFLRRHLNQVYAGWFIGLTLYVLVTLASVAPTFNPVFGATLTLLLALSALYVLLLLVYGAVAQMRPAAILEAIHDHTLVARERQRKLLRRTRRQSRSAASVQRVVRADRNGFVTRIDLDIIAPVLAAAPQAEVILRLPVGGYAAWHDPLAEVRALSPDEAIALAAATTRAIRLDRERDLDADPGYGVEQIATIGWTSISSAKQDPQSGVGAVRNLRDLLARWTAADDAAAAPAGQKPLAVVYPDTLLDQVLAALEAMAVAATESRQQQTLAALLGGLAVTVDRLPAPLQERTAGLVRRSLDRMSGQVPTAEFDAARRAIAAAFSSVGMDTTAAEVSLARDERFGLDHRLDAVDPRFTNR